MMSLAAAGEGLTDRPLALGWLDSQVEAVDRVGAVLFDFDGVIMETEPLWRAAFRQVLSSHAGIDVSEARLIRLTGLRVPETLTTILREQDVPSSSALRESDVTRLAFEVIALVSSMVDAEGLAIESTVAVIKQLGKRQLLQGVATSSHLLVVRKALADLGILDTFARVASSYELAEGKPHPRIYVELAESMKCLPQRCVVVEDSAVGVEAAVRAGMSVVGLWRRDEAPPPIFAKCRTVVRELTLGDVLPLSSR